MFISGLVSVSFRKESPEAIVAAAAQAGLQGIEWGGDIHVPCGDIENAKRVSALTHWYKKRRHLLKRQTKNKSPLH